jgi:hypothetical protein
MMLPNGLGRCVETMIVMIRETPSTVLFRTILTSDPSIDVSAFLYSYFQVSQSLPLKLIIYDASSNPQYSSCLQDLYQEWSTQCDRIQQVVACLPGVRILDQDPWECLVSFFCYSNNNIPRIIKMLSSVRRHYGDHHVCTVSSYELGQRRKM